MKYFCMEELEGVRGDNISGKKFKGVDEGWPTHGL